jgi:hypothetical protein
VASTTEGNRDFGADDTWWREKERERKKERERRERGRKNQEERSMGIPKMMRRQAEIKQAQRQWIDAIVCIAIKQENEQTTDRVTQKPRKPKKEHPRTNERKTQPRTGESRAEQAYQRHQ